MQACVDHLVFATDSLDAGADWLEHRLGVPLSAGGSHSIMGTHNRLLRLGSRLYLELIAIDPKAKQPNRARWFGLDSFKAGGQKARLIAWAVCVTDLAGLKPSYDAGRPMPMSRGDLSWRISVREDGSMPENGALPALIEWPSGVHPATSLPDRGVWLEEMEIFAPDPGPVKSAFASIGLDPAANRIAILPDIEGPRLSIRLKTPNDLVSFSTSG
jgi:hypothetical protein